MRSANGHASRCKAGYPRNALSRSGRNGGAGGKIARKTCRHHPPGASRIVHDTGPCPAGEEQSSGGGEGIPGKARQQ